MRQGKGSDVSCSKHGHINVHDEQQLCYDWQTGGLNHLTNSWKLPLYNQWDVTWVSSNFI